jgi:hypothetical protein
MPSIKRHACFIAPEPEASPLLTQLAPMAIGTQALQVAKHEGIPITLMWDNVIDLRGWNGPTQLTTMPAYWLDLQLIGAPIAPALKLIPISPSSRTGSMRISPRSRHA